MSYLSTPSFPVISWSIDLDGTDEITVAVSGGSTYSGFIPAGTYYGYASSTGSDDAAADSLAGIVAATIQDIMQDPAKFNQATATCVALYLHSPTGTEITTRYTRANFFPLAATITVTITAGTLTLQDLGFETSFQWTTLGGLSRTNNWNSIGYWAPGNITVYDERNQTMSSFVTESIFNNSISTVRWGSPKVRRNLVFPTVYAAMIYTYRRVDSGFADVAQVDVADPNNLLEYLFEAASEGLTFRIYQEPAVYRTAVISDQGSINDMNSNLEDISARGSIWSVTCRFLDLGTTTGAV